MRATNCLGVPAEYFNKSARRRYDDPVYPADPVEQIYRVLRDGACETGTYALKLFPSHSVRVMRHLDWTAVLPDLHFVHLTRADVLAQAISLVKAYQTGRYRSTDAVAGRSVQFDARAIRAAIDRITAANAYWEAFFARRGIAPLRLIYEDVMADLPDALARVGGLVGGTPTLGPDWHPTLKPQRNGVSADWRALFLAWEENRSVWPWVARLRGRGLC